MKVFCGSSMGSHPGLVPITGFGFQFRNGKMRRLPKIERRAGTVTIASGNARLKRRPRLARASTLGVWICGAP